MSFSESIARVGHQIDHLGSMCNGGRDVNVSSVGRLAPSSGGRAPAPRDQRCQMTSHHHGDRRADCASLLCRFSPLFFSLIKLEQPLSLRSRSRSEVSSPPATRLYGRCGNGIRLKFHRLCLRRRHSAIDKKQITGAAADVTPAE